MEVAQFSTVASRNFLATSHSISTNRSLCNSRRLARKSTKFVSSWTGSSTASSPSSRNLFTLLFKVKRIIAVDKFNHQQDPGEFICSAFDCDHGALGMLHVEFTHSTHKNPAKTSSSKRALNSNPFI
ncbi:hypothetical protein Q3G72_020884 [Acer saccharum]|nr:hypothetical protein Q3G72_020884 [Acer saccharum]